MEDVFIHPLAVVDEGAQLGDGTKVWHFAHVRSTAKLGRNVIVGKSSYVDAGVDIGDNVKIQNLVSIYNGVSVANDVFIGPHVAFTNDLYPRATGDWEITRTKIAEGVSIGANATIVCGNDIGKYALIAAGAVVTKPVTDHALVAGNPARLLGWVCFCSRKIASRDLASGNHKLTCAYCNREVSLQVP